MIMNYLGIALLFGAIIYTGRQANIYFRMRRRLGKLVMSLSPSEGQRKMLMFSSAAFVVLLCVVTYNYVSADITLNYSYTMLLAVVIFSAGRFFANVVELRQDGILGNLEEITYKDVKYFSYEGQGRRQMVRFHLKDGREFLAIAAKSDKERLEETMKKMQGKK